MLFVPRGSDSICGSCEDINKCECWTTGYILKNTWNGVPVSFTFKDFYSVGQIRSCPLDKFNPTEEYIRWKEKYDIKSKR